MTSDAGQTAPGWEEVLDFWFDPAHEALWFEADAAFDARIRDRFAPLIEAGIAGALRGWEAAPQSCLALVILLDQMTRNAWRRTPRAFSGDAMALAVATRALAAGVDRQVSLSQRRFLYLPREHILAELRPSGARVGVAYFAELDTDMTTRGFGTEAASALTRRARGFHRVAPLSAGIKAIERGMERRSRRAVFLPANVRSPVRDVRQRCELHPRDRELRICHCHREPSETGFRGNHRRPD